MPQKHQEMQTYTPDEIRRVLRAADKDRSGHLWYLALSGLRRGEIAGLKWSDINLDDGTIAIARNRVRAGLNVVEGDPKTLRRGARCRSTMGWSVCSGARRPATHKSAWRWAGPMSIAAMSR
jgi:hypothetical protein